MVRWRTGLVIMIGFFLVVPIGCGGEEALLNAAHATRGGEVFLRPVTQPAVGKTIDEALVSLARAQTWEEARASLVELYTSRDFYDRLLASGLTNALCSGFSQIAEGDRAATPREWEDFLESYLIAKAFAPVAVARRYANQLTTLGNLANVSPALARTYYAACIRR